MARSRKRPALETPPRAWGRPTHAAWMLLKPRNTPTGVGKTASTSASIAAHRKHPHGRGEDFNEMEEQLRGDGNTPTGVGKTSWPALTASRRWKHPETPPRAWGRPALQHIRPVRAGNTPTGVGKTLFSGLCTTDNRKHPHGRGEDGSSSAGPSASRETPPRAWGRP